MAPKREDVASLTAPENLQQVLRDEAKDDCLACRLMGGGAFMGLGVFTWVNGMENLKRNERVILKSGSKYGMASRQLGIRGIALTFIGLGVYRMIN